MVNNNEHSMDGLCLEAPDCHSEVVFRFSNLKILGSEIDGP